MVEFPHGPARRHELHGGRALTLGSREGADIPLLEPGQGPVDLRLELVEGDVPVLTVLEGSVWHREQELGAGERLSLLSGDVWIGLTCLRVQVECWQDALAVEVTSERGAGEASPALRDAERAGELIGSVRALRHRKVQRGTAVLFLLVGGLGMALAFLVSAHPL